MDQTAETTTSTESQGITQEQLDQAPDYGESKDTSYSHTQNEIQPPKEAAKESADPQAKYEFTHNGKKVSGTIDQMIKWAQMGYDRPQQQQKFNQQVQKWNQEKQQLEQQYSPYKQIDEYAKQNPQWWNSVKQQWEARGNQPGQTQDTNPQNSAYEQKIKALEEQIAQISQPVNQFLTLQQQEQVKKEDSALDTEIKSIREQYKNLDFDTLDENGKSLEFRVLEHASQNGIRSFTTAFRDLCHDQILSHAQQQAKLNVASEVQKNTRLGILGKSPTPQQDRNLEPPKNIRQKSYNDIDQEALAYLKEKGISLSGRH